MENDEPVDDGSNDPAPSEQPALAVVVSPASPAQEVSERDQGHNERLSRMRFVQPALEEDYEHDVEGPIVEEADDDDDELPEEDQDALTFDDNSSENGLDDSDADRLFDDYINNRGQHQSTAAEIYNTELPTEHAYLGKLERVEGVDYLEPGKIYRLPICSHNSIVFPGEIVPMILNVATLNCNDPSDGVKFGLVFRTTFADNFIYGVTCQVFERGDHDANGSIVLKTVAQQRFHTVRHLPGRRADVLILPEILLPDPLLSSCSNLMKRHAVSNDKQHARRFKAFLSHAMTWPKFVYDQYGTEEVLSKVDRYLAFLKITSVPSDPVKLSFWLARNIPIDERDRKLIYQANAVISRMLVINKSLDHMCYFLCKRCDNEVGSYNDIFAMSKQGVQTSYCNPSGFVHETLTIYKTKENSTFSVDRPTTEFSWFPGYAWQITLCANCREHLGWKFVATKKNYLPTSFYGLSGNNIKVKSVNRVVAAVDEDDEHGSTERITAERDNSDTDDEFGAVYEIIDMDADDEGRENLIDPFEPEGGVAIEDEGIVDETERDELADDDRFQDAVE
ncbi:protein cereblon-like [Wyeomyia smithii]|uniref:protein cereblon-like n=1 Tax=Wyeomyia smithii TaxID=174621 RepID=UPI0024680706|nr:protein cereblon-like [Wyeomyia smithii]